MSSLTIIGRAERAILPELSTKRIPVKIDTGADACSIWAHMTEEKNGKLHVIFFGPDSKYYDGKEHVFNPRDYSLTRVANSFGHKELRYKVKLKITVKDRTIRGSFTLSDRSKKLYPILIGRSLLRNKFLVDVSKGNPLITEERKRAQRLKTELENGEQI
ncbi:MAG: hypothetical protein JWM00_597 [Candidatus Saccharibacteria bacterium]|nr:hypothetical protein [Candidatus Saccharibacteria bacterium]